MEVLLIFRFVAIVFCCFSVAIAGETLVREDLGSDDHITFFSKKGYMATDYFLSVKLHETNPDLSTQRMMTITKNTGAYFSPNAFEFLLERGNESVQEQLREHVRQFNYDDSLKKDLKMQYIYHLIRSADEKNQEFAKAQKEKLVGATDERNAIRTARINWSEHYAVLGEAMSKNRGLS